MLKKLPSRLITIFAVASLLLTGCATRNLPNVGESCYYQHCVEPLVEIQKRDNAVAVETAKGAAAGALAGAVIGMIASGNWKGALIGAAVGALGVGAISYTFTKLDQVADENTRFASIRVTANQDLTKANRLQLYSYESMACYMREFDRLQDAYEGGSMTKEEYAKRFQEIRRAMTALGEVIGNMEADIQRTEHEFNTSFAKGPAKAQMEAAAPPAVSAQKTRTPARKPARQPGKQRAGKRMSDTLAKHKRQVEQTQAKNDDDLAAILDDFAGKVSPPLQNVAAIKKEYGQGYKATRSQMEDLRAVHQEALGIMDAAAMEAGIDMI